MNMLQKVIVELNRRKGQWPQIATDNGVSYSWLCKLAQGKIQNPSVVTIESLYLYLRVAA